MNKEQQIEIIIDEIRKFNKKIVEIDNILQTDINDEFGSLYDIGYKLIPDILRIEEDTLEYDILQELNFNVMNNLIEKQEYLDRISKYI